MKSVFKDMTSEVVDFVKLIFVLIIGGLILATLAKLYPNTPGVGTLVSTFDFFSKLIIDWGSPDPVLWIVRIVVAVLCAYVYFNEK